MTNSYSHRGLNNSLSLSLHIVTVVVGLCSVYNLQCAHSFQVHVPTTTTTTTTTSFHRRILTHNTNIRTKFPLKSTSSSDTDATLPSFYGREDYMKYLSDASALPQGFSCGVATGQFQAVEAPLLGSLFIRGTVIYLTDGPSNTWAATFTSNRFPGAPIKVGKKLLSEASPLQAIVINNKVSNVCAGTPDGGVSEALQVCEAVAKCLNLPNGRDNVLPSSTGVIGWRLPAKELAEEVVPAAVQNLQSDSVLGAAEAICTTDRYPKLRSKTLSNGARIIGIAKGAGMIEPNMATMLCYVLTDAIIPPDVSLQSILSSTVNDSFNSISVDGDESTSDTTVVLSSEKIPDTDMDEFTSALSTICTGLASDLVRNGEGTSHVIRVQIDNFPGSDQDARRLGRHVVNSPLFKCAVSGNDPNIGRLAGAIGSFLGKMESDKAPSTVDKMTLTLGGRVIFNAGKFVLEGDEVERVLSDHMKNAQFGEMDDFPRHQMFVEVGVDFGEGEGSGKAVVLGSDLTAEYVSVNADYRS